MIRSVVFLLLAGVLAGPAPAQTAREERTLLGGVTVSGRSIVFSYAGDLWRVEMSGGTAERLTSGPEEDDYPVFAPNGARLAFSRRGAEDWDVYVMSAEGGNPRRLTYNPEADIARGWRPDSARILFMSHRDEEGVFRLYTIAEAGGFPRPLAFPRGWDGSYAPGALRLAYVPVAQPLELRGVEWRHYRGGLTSPIWVADIESGAIEPIPRENWNDRQPMWVGDVIYFVSDRSGTFNLHSYDPQARRVEQLTEYETYGIESASAGSGFIAFVRDGGIHLFDLQSGAVQSVEFTVPADSSELMPRTVSGMRWIESLNPSPSGDVLVVSARGEVLTYRIDQGEWENLTRTAGAAERYPVMSPDGRWIAYFSDEPGEYELRVRSTSDSTIHRIPVELESSFYRELTWSPDSRHIAFSDRRLTLWVADVETRGARRVATSPSSSQDRFYPAWSPDGLWLAFSMVEANRVPTVYLYHVQRARSVSVTDGRVHAEHPVFDRGGDYLYFIASNTAGMGEFGWSVLSGMIHRPLVTRRIQMVMLRPGAQAPLLPIIGEPNPQADAAPAPPRRAEDRPRPQRPRGRRRGGPEQAPGAVDPRGIENRIVPLPLPERDYAAVSPAGPRALFVLVTEWPDSPGLGSSPTRSLYRWDVARPRELTKLAEDVTDFSVAADGQKVVVRSGETWTLIEATGEGEPETAELDLSSLSIEVTPAAEWRQIYDEAWRLMAGYFYDPSTHGQKPEELEAHYATYLPSITRRADLNTLLGKALGHISVSHVRVTGGDIPQPEGPGDRVGLLGADYQLDEDRYRITRVYRSAHFNTGHPLMQAPLDQPGVDVSEGDYLLEVDGQPVSGATNLYSYFQGKALKSVRITVSADRTGENSRTYTVVPLPGENTLRRINWAERNRRIVEEESRGILGYIHISSFSATSLEMVFRQLLESSDRRGLIIDQRFNGGGITADYLIEWLRRRPLYYYAFRQGSNLAIPTNPPPAAQVLLINEVNASAAETFAFMFKLGDMGRVIGTRTRGAGIGGFGFLPSFIDGGRVTVPNRAAFDPAGDWGIENHGVEPDTEVHIMPTDWRQGRDPQLAAAINAVLQMIVDSPPLEVKRPEYPEHR